ncbi:antithrombin-iii-like isoform 2 protein [Lasius niger]|uniref:Antithrombin-iii-like isoform 2 protein n=1 Tax=Lasius niger TaxID=67767 RepID=A0A0J7JXG0_LASNI|nr:antithrombin-iii-like isoform 2 protein [Lasius niger]
MHVIEFPYANENRSLFMFLPGSISLGDYNDRSAPRESSDIICNLIERLSTEEAMRTLRNLLDSDIPPSEDYFLIGPTFEVEINLRIRGLLQYLYVEQLLKPDDAINLDSFFVDDDSVHLGNAVHRTHIKVTEEDTVAASVNLIYTGQGIPPAGSWSISGYDFPFVWLIYDKQRRNILFTGSCYNYY